MCGAISSTVRCARARRRRSIFSCTSCSSFPASRLSIYAGYYFAAHSWRINEHSSITADGPPLYYFKFMIPVAGALVMLQAVAEIVRCVVCIRTGVWPDRLKDVTEIDVVEEQLAAERARRRGNAPAGHRARP